MKLQLSVIIFLILKFVIYLSTKVSGDDISRNKLYASAISKLNDQEIKTALSISNVSQIENVKQFITIRQHPFGFVSKLDEFKTLSDKPIVLTSEEIRTLTSNGNVTRGSKIRTQVKFYRKIQEIQCTNYEMLNFILPDIGNALINITVLVYNMIEISYYTSFPVGAWLWELYIKLTSMRDDQFKLTRGIFHGEHLPAISNTLKKIIISCKENNYPITMFDTSVYSSYYERIGRFNEYLDMYQEKCAKFLIPRESTYRLPFQARRLILDALHKLPGDWFFDIDGLDFNWSIIYDVLTKEIDNIVTGYTKIEWATDPFRFIKSHEIVLDAIKARLCSFLWVHLYFYQKTVGSKDHHEELISCLNESITFDYIDDLKFDQVLILLSKIGGPNDEQIHDAIEILSSEVNSIIGKYTEPSHVAKIDEGHIERYYKNNYSTFLAEHRKSFLQFEKVNADTLGEFNLKLISFYIKGSKTTNIVFPNISQ